MAQSILRTALRLRDTRDAIIFGRTLSQEEISELKRLLVLMRHFNQQIDHKPDLQMKVVWRIQFVREAIEFSNIQTKGMYKTLAEENVKIFG